MKRVRWLLFGIVIIAIVVCLIRIPVKVDIDCTAIGFDYNSKEFVREHTVKMKGTLWLSVLRYDYYDGSCYIDSGAEIENRFVKWNTGNVRRSLLTKGKEIHFLTHEGDNPIGTVYENGSFKNVAIMRGYFVEGTADKETEVIVCGASSVDEAVAIWEKMQK